MPNDSLTVEQALLNAKQGEWAGGKHLGVFVRYVVRGTWYVLVEVRWWLGGGISGSAAISGRYTSLRLQHFVHYFFRYLFFSSSLTPFLI